LDKYFKISFAGSGNVAWHLSQALENTGHSILEIYSRNIRNAQKLCDKLYQAQAKDNLNFSKDYPEVLIIAVSDKAIRGVLEEITIPKEAIIIHTSGTESIRVFEDMPNPFGVLYPIQTFSKDRPIDFRNVPFSIEASDNKTKGVLSILARSLSKKIYFNTTEQRRIIHLSSVFAANFTNHMFTISKGLLESNNLSFDLVKPLIEEVVHKAFILGPENAQTGPAVRNDFNTIQKHMSYLSEEEGLTEIYNAITSDIIKTFEE
jgi:predicted short-subunit dehydrogenase-like oxidoreductase (DUF2520 family)